MLQSVNSQAHLQSAPGTETKTWSTAEAPEQYGRTLEALRGSFETEAWWNRGQSGPRSQTEQRGRQDNQITEINWWEAGGRGPQREATEEDGYWRKI